MLHYLSQGRLGNWPEISCLNLQTRDLNWPMVISEASFIYKEKIDEAEEWFKKAEQSDCLLAPAAYDYGVLLWLGKDKWEDSFKYFQKSAEEGFEPAYGQLGTILYLEKLDIDEAERWFEKAEKAGCLDAPAST
jgi:TPR repeat protein